MKKEETMWTYHKLDDLSVTTFVGGAICTEIMRKNCQNNKHCHWIPGFKSDEEIMKKCRKLRTTVEEI